jgi:hypothetical protein
MESIIPNLMERKFSLMLDAQSNNQLDVMMVLVELDHRIVQYYQVVH